MPRSTADETLSMERDFRQRGDAGVFEAPRAGEHIDGHGAVRAGQRGHVLHEADHGHGALLEQDGLSASIWARSWGVVTKMAPKRTSPAMTCSSSPVPGGASTTMSALHATSNTRWRSSVDVGGGLQCGRDSFGHLEADRHHLNPVALPRVPPA